MVTPQWVKQQRLRQNIREDEGGERGNVSDVIQKLNTVGGRANNWTWEQGKDSALQLDWLSGLGEKTEGGTGLVAEGAGGKRVLLGALPFEMPSN